MKTKQPTNVLCKLFLINGRIIEKQKWVTEYCASCVISKGVKRSVYPFGCVQCPHQIHKKLHMLLPFLPCSLRRSSLILEPKIKIMKEDHKYKLRESIALRYRAISVEGMLVARSGDAFEGLMLLLFSGMVIWEQRRANKTSTKEVAYGRLRRGHKILFC